MPELWSTLPALEANAVLQGSECPGAVALEMGS